MTVNEKHQVSGEVFQVNLFSRGGAILEPTGTLFVCDRDPGVSVGDTTLPAAIREGFITQIDVAAGDWVQPNAGGNIAVATMFDRFLFPPVRQLWLVWYHTLATTINSGAGDDEYLECSLMYHRLS